MISPAAPDDVARVGDGRTAPLLARLRSVPLALAGSCQGERMPAERAMRHVREVLRLKAAGVSGNEIARRLNLSPSAVRLTLQRLAAGLGSPLPAEMTDARLEAQLFTAVDTKQGHRRHAEPDWAELHRELKRKHDAVPVIIDRLNGKTRPAQMPKRAGRRRSAIRLAPTRGPLRRSAACPGCWCRTTPRWRSSRPVSTSRRSIAPRPSPGQALRRDDGPLRSAARLYRVRCLFLIPWSANR
jgi:hypothetical protein